MGNAGGAAKHTKSVYSTLFLGYQKSGKFQSQSRMMQTVDAYVDMYIPSALGA